MKDWQLFGRFAQRFHVLTNTFLDEVGVPRGQASALMTIANEEGMTQTQLGTALCIQGATVTTMLQRMEEGQLVRRERDTHDNRLVRVYLTDRGREKTGEILERLRALQARLWQGIPQEELEHMRTLVERMMANMDTV